MAGFTFFRRKSFVSQCQKIRGGILHCLRKLLVSENFVHKKETSLFSFEDFPPHSAENICRGTFLCFRKFRYRRFSCVAKGRASRYCGKKLCLTGPKRKFLLGNCLVFPKNFWYRQNCKGRRSKGTEWKCWSLKPKTILKSQQYLTRQKFVPVYTASERCGPNATAYIYFWIKSVASFRVFGWKKTKNNPTEWIIFLACFKWGRKISF